MEQILIGDVVLSVAGKDQGRLFLVVDVKDGYAFITDGKLRKVTALKKKKLKHLSRVFVAGDIELAIKIKDGEAVGNDRVKRAINQLIEKV